MDITFACESCGQSIVIDEAGTGIRVKCPKCQAALVVPEPPLTFRCKCGHHIVIDEADARLPGWCPKCHRSLPGKLPRDLANAVHNKTQVALAKGTPHKMQIGKPLTKHGAVLEKRNGRSIDKRNTQAKPIRKPNGKLSRWVVDWVTSRTILRNPLCDTEPVKFQVDGVEITCNPPHLGDLYHLRDSRSVQLWVGEPHDAWEQLSSEDVQGLVRAYEKAWIL